MKCNNITPTIQYAWLTLKHKWFVVIAGMKTKAPLWRLIIHDWTKFLPSELPHYGRQFFGKKNNPAGWIRCWLHHQNSNPHHWEYWISRSGIRLDESTDDFDYIDMPEWAVREMLADYLAAGRAYEGKWPDIHNWTWLKKNCGNLRITWNTRCLMAKILHEMGVESFNADYTTGVAS